MRIYQIDPAVPRHAPEMPTPSQTTVMTDMLDKIELGYGVEADARGDNAYPDA